MGGKKVLKYGYFPITEILKASNYSLSRCFLRDYEKAEEAGFSRNDVEELIKRVNKGKNTIKNVGWDDTSVFVLGKVVGVDGWVIVDGQGRKIIVQDLIEEGFLTMSLMVFIFYMEYETFEDMEKHITELNSSKVKTPYHSDEILRIKQLSGNNKSAIDAYNLIKTKKEEWGCPSTGTVSTLIFRYDTVRKDRDTVFKIENVDDFKLHLYDYLFKGINATLLEAKFSEVLIKKAKNFASSEAYMQIIDNLVDRENGMELSVMFVKRFIKILSKLSIDDYKYLYVGGTRTTKRNIILKYCIKGLKEGNELLSVLREIYGKFATK